MVGGVRPKIVVTGSVHTNRQSFAIAYIVDASARCRGMVDG